jgi:hypothetical protein
MDGVAITYFALADDLLAELKGAGFSVESWKVEPGEPGRRSDFFRAICRKPSGN